MSSSRINRAKHIYLLTGRKHARLQLVEHIQFLSALYLPRHDARTAVGQEPIKSIIPLSSKTTEIKKRQTGNAARQSDYQEEKLGTRSIAM